MNKQITAGALLLFSGLCLGVGIGQVYRWFRPQPFETSTYFYYSASNNEKILSVDSKGNVDFGSRYDRKTEATKLVELVQRMLGDGTIADCHETGYRSPYWGSPDQGMMQVFPGPANPPPPVIRWHIK